MLDKTSLTSRLLDLARTVAPGLSEAKADVLTTDLRDAGMSSVAAVRFMLDVEAAFDIAIPDADLTPENFANVNSIEHLILRLKAAA